MNYDSKLLRRLKDSRGVTIIIFAILIVVLLGFVALAVDIGHLKVVRNELQNAADAAALAGARVLYNPNTPPTSPPPAPATDTAYAAATAAIQINKSDGSTLKDGDVRTGGWDFTTNKWTDTPDYSKVAAAVKVTISRTSGQNGGPVTLLFAPILGTNFASVSAQAVAVMGSPGFANTGSLFPLAISSDLANKYASYTCSSGNTFNIGSSYHYPISEAGQWTTLNLGTDNVPDVAGLMTTGNTIPLKMTDPIFIAPGTKTALYKDVNSYLANGGSPDVVLPIVDVSVLDKKGWTPIYGFIGFHIITAVGGSGKYVEGCFTSGIFEGLGPGGPYYGIYAPIKLVY